MLKFFTQIILFLFFSNCLVKNHEAARYTKNFNLLNQSILEQFEDYDLRQILYGNLNPKLENQLFKDGSDNLYIVMNGKFLNNSQLLLQTSSQEKKDSDYLLRIEYKKIKWNEEDLYQVKRKQTNRMGDFKPSIFWENLSRMIEQDIKTSFTQQQLCKSFKCLVEETKDFKILTYEFDEKTKTEYPEFYEKYATRFDLLKFKTLIIPNGNYSTPIIVENDKRKLIIKLPRNGSMIWKNPSRLNFVLDFTLKTYGLTFKVNQMQYIINYKKEGSTEYLSGRFFGIPEYNLDGRFFYIIPQGLVDFFIPGNIEEYLDKGLTLVTVGSDGKSGSHFHAKYFGKGKSAYFTNESYSEVYQKRFSLFASKETQKQKNKGDIEFFIRDLWSEIARDLEP